MFHVKCELNLGVETLFYFFLGVKVDGRLVPCVLLTTIIALMFLYKVVTFEQIMSRNFTTVTKLSHNVVV